MDTEDKIYIPIEDVSLTSALFGQYDENIRVIEDEINVRVSMESDNIVISGEEEAASLAGTVINRLIILLRKGERIDKSRIRYAIELAAEGRDELIEEIMSDVVAINYRGNHLKSKTHGQQKYVSAKKNNTITVGIGPAGTGKTYLAMAMAVMAFKNKEVARIVLTRPAVEAGEKLGFLPGDLQHKVDPYLRPLYDALYEMMGMESYQKLAERGVIEVAPLAYMRGRTLNESFIILDEAQNTTIEQMKMFLTRLGDGSRMVVTGDLTQVDLPPGKLSGLKHASQILTDIEGIAICQLTHKDVVRHELVQNIIKAYDKRSR